MGTRRSGHLPTSGLDNGCHVDVSVSLRGNQVAWIHESLSGSWRVTIGHYY